MKLELDPQFATSRPGATSSPVASDQDPEAEASRHAGADSPEAGSAEAASDVAAVGVAACDNTASENAGSGVAGSSESDRQALARRLAERFARITGPRKLRLWFDRSAHLDVDETLQHVTVTAPTRFIAEWLRRNFERDLLAAAEAELGRPTSIVIEIQPERFHRDQASPTPLAAVKAAARAARGGATSHPGSDDDEPGQAAAASAGSLADGAPDGAPDGAGLARRASPRPAAAPTVHQPASAHPRRRDAGRGRLDQFIVGPSNELAFAAASQAADPDQHPAPLFLHGGCGLGKTHLLQGVCNRFLEHRPDARVRYVTGEQFTNEYLEALRGGKIDAFRRQVRRLDLLAVDDVHFLAGKESTLQEFQHCFDAIGLGGARLVLASDHHPKAIRSFNQHVVSRCVSGMVVEIGSPDNETRVRIIRSLAARRGMPVLDTVIEVLARRFQGSVRELEGALTKLSALAQLVQQHEPGGPGDAVVGHALLDRLLQAEQRAAPARPIRYDLIRDVVCRHLGIEARQLAGRSRQKLVVLARGLIAHLARTLTTMSYPDIARAMQRDNHSTVVTAVQRINRQLEGQETIDLHGERITLDELLQRLRHQIQHPGRS